MVLEEFEAALSFTLRICWNARLRVGLVLAYTRGLVWQKRKQFQREPSCLIKSVPNVREIASMLNGGSKPPIGWSSVEVYPASGSPDHGIL